MSIVALIGAGQLGSRHLQSLARSSVEISVEIVEPYARSRETALARYEEMESNPNIRSINFFESIEQLSEQLDFVIIATNADVRSRLVNELVSRKRVKYLLLEKVLFQSVEEYREVAQLLEHTGTRCWVNHPRRMFPFYQKLRDDIRKCGQVSFMVQGGAWGLGCNGLHFLDLLSFLSHEDTMAIDNDFLHPKVYEAKRLGYVEFNGLLKGRIGNHVFALFSDAEYIPVTLTITTETLTAFIDEANGYVRMARKENDWQWEEVKEKIIYFQSELTHRVLEQLLKTGECDLPTYTEAMQLHVPFIEALLSHMEHVEGQVFTLCPIT